MTRAPIEPTGPRKARPPARKGRTGVPMRHGPDFGESRVDDEVVQLETLIKQRRAAANVLEGLTQELLELKGKPKSKFDKFCDDAFRDGDADVVQQWDKYRERIGFDGSSVSAEKYLNELMRLARDVIKGRAKS